MNHFIMNEVDHLHILQIKYKLTPLVIGFIWGVYYTKCFLDDKQPTLIGFEIEYLREDKNESTSI